MAIRGYCKELHNRTLIELDVRPGLPSFTIQGVPDHLVRTMLSLVRNELEENRGIKWPAERITVKIGRTTGDFIQTNIWEVRDAIADGLEVLA